MDVCGGTVRRWEFVGGKSEKFWESGLTGTAVTTRYGRIATNGQATVKQFDSATEAESYLARLIAEKEKKGYSEVAGTSEPATATATPDSADDSAGEAPAAARPPQTGLPDEETFELPGSWRRVLHPRRGGIARPPAKVDADDVAEVGKWTRQGEHLIRAVLGDSTSDRQLVKELQAHVDGPESPRGAALVAQLVATQTYLDRGKLADAWVAAHGLVFAARTVMEMCEVRVNWNSGLTGKNAPWLEFRPAGEPLGWHWQWRPAAERLRALLACAAERDYRAVVEALAAHRTGDAQRIIAAYLVPTETAWVDERCANPPTGNDNAVGRTLLFCALGSPEQVAALGPHAKFGWGQWSLDILATTADGIGASVAPMLVDALDEDSGGADARKMVLGALSRLPTDEAFQIMVDRIDQKYVQSALLEAMRRFPVRGLRLLALAAGGRGKNSSSAMRLLTGHLLAEADLVAAVLPVLSEEVRAAVAEASERLVRVEEAPAESLPRLLSEPPWTRKRKAVAPAIVTGLEPTDEAEISWRPGEKDEWGASTSHHGRLVDNDWDAAIRRYHDPARPGIPGYEEVALFMNGPERLVRPLLADWTPRYPWGAETWMKPIVAKYEAEALSPTLEVAAGNPASTGSLLLPFRDICVARLMADWLIRLKAGRKVALTWFGRHGVEAARLLVPDAVGVAGKARAGAEAALRLVATATGDEAVVRAAESYGAEAAKAVEALLAADPLDNVPARLPKPGAWADPALLPQVLLRDRTHALPLPAVGHVLTMLALSKPGEVYPGLAVVREVCDPASLAEFGWEVFERWRTAGLPAKDGWALTGLGWIGDDETVRRLTPIIRAWPGESGHQRAVTGLDVLAAIGTEIALMHLNGISQRVKFKGLKTRAQEKIQEVAEGLGLTSEQLADRLVPDFGLDENGSMVLDYGPRRFVVGFDEQLKPYVEDENGKRRKDLPAPGARDDAEKAPAAKKRFSDLKKDVRTVAGDLIRHLEAATVARRTWTKAEFDDLFVGHPLTWHLARRLVWVAESGGGTDGEQGARTEFRVAEDRTLADAEDDIQTLPGDARIHLAHPLEMAGTLGAWSEVFADYEILQPFPQLGRAVHALTEEERGGSHLTRFENATVATGRLLGMQRRGWARGEPQDAGVERWFSREVGPNRFVVLDLDPGIAVGLVDEFPEQTLRAVWLNTGPDDYRPSRTTSLRFGDLDPVMASEVLADLAELTS
jgi:predicted DNA-binding WGR domain protein